MYHTVDVLSKYRQQKRTDVIERCIETLRSQFPDNPYLEIHYVSNDYMYVFDLLGKLLSLPQGLDTNWEPRDVIIGFPASKNSMYFNEFVEVNKIEDIY